MRNAGTVQWDVGAVALEHSAGSSFARAAGGAAAQGRSGRGRGRGGHHQQHQPPHHVDAAPVALGARVAPGGECTLVLDLAAPLADGHHVGAWRMVRRSPIVDATEFGEPVLISMLIGGSASASASGIGRPQNHQRVVSAAPVERLPQFVSAHRVDALRAALREHGERERRVARQVAAVNLRAASADEVTRLLRETGYDVEAVARHLLG
jgi:hypothetical protein